jgi:hypothetical protein
MSDTDGASPHWWQELKEQSLERRALEAEQAASATTGDTFLVVTEGTVTEPAYFEVLLERQELLRVWVKVIPGEHSDPRHVIKTAEQVAKQQLRRAKKKQLGIDEPEAFDQVWAVIDTDVAVRDDFWNEVVQLAKARNVRLAHSTPCFEFWLLLHISGYTTRTDLVDGMAAKRAVKTALGREYSTNSTVARDVFPQFVPNWPNALIHSERIRRHHADAGNPEPANPSTEVDRLLRALNDSAPLYLRKLRSTPRSD